MNTTFIAHRPEGGGRRKAWSLASGRKHRSPTQNKKKEKKGSKSEGLHGKDASSSKKGRGTKENSTFRRPDAPFRQPPANREVGKRRWVPIEEKKVKEIS